MFINAPIVYSFVSYAYVLFERSLKFTVSPIKGVVFEAEKFATGGSVVL